MAEAVSKLIGGEIHEIPSQSCNVESIEAVMRICAYVPQGGRGAFHVIIANEADRMSPAGQVKFLSILDRVPDQTIIFFTANDTACLEKRFLSRCRVLNFKAETVESELAAYLERIYKAEGGTFPVDFPKIARECENNVRAALGRLDVELLLGADRADLPEPKQADVQKNAIQTPAESRPETFYVRSARRRNRQAIKGLRKGEAVTLAPYVSQAIGIRATYLGRTYEGQIRADGRIEINGGTFNTPAAAAAAISRSASGWQFFKFERGGNLHPIDALRR